MDASGEDLKEEDKAASLLLSVKWKEYELDLDSEERFKTFGEREKDTKEGYYAKSHFQILFDNLSSFWGGQGGKRDQRCFSFR